MSTKLRQRQHKAIALLVQGTSSTEIAKQLKLRKETLSRWKKNPTFHAELERVMRDVRSGFEHRLAHLVDESITAVKTELHRYHSDPKRVQTALNVIKLLTDKPKPAPKAPNPADTNPL